MKLGCLPYLNVKPLIYSLEQGEIPSGWELVYAPPAELAKMLVSGEIAAAPVSSFATFTHPELEVCPGICIAADGPVKSVLMLSRVMVQNINTIALDYGSLSGANMLRIILAESYGLHPRFLRMTPHPVSAMLDQCDAALVIGDPAMTCPREGLYILDLAEEWKKLTGLPAVFALWVGREMTDEIVAVLHESCEKGLSQLEKIAKEESTRLGLSFETCYEYLSTTITYRLGEREAEGLAVFRSKCLEHSLLNTCVTSVEAVG
ncbi:MAG: menaquinone biosynthesis protein [Armatimonadetes bacterium]|nr:menaquinone biosynthesis protein [Armatimonadota bacterium]